MSRHTILVRLALVAGGAYALTGALELSHEQPTVFVDNIVIGGGTLVLAATWAAFSRLMSVPHSEERPRRRPGIAIDGSH